MLLMYCYNITVFDDRRFPNNIGPRRVGVARRRLVAQCSREGRKDGLETAPGSFYEPGTVRGVSAVVRGDRQSRQESRH